MPRMSASFVEQRTGPRYMVHISVRAEWDDERSGEHVVVDGETENIGPQGALVHLERLPDVGGRVRLIVPGDEGRTVEPVAALQLLGETDEWRGLVWEPAGIKEREADEDYSEYEN